MPRTMHGVFEKLYEPASQPQYTNVVAIEYQPIVKKAILHMRPAQQKSLVMIESIVTPKPVDMQLATSKWEQDARGPVLRMNFINPVTVSHAGVTLYIEPA